MVLSRSLFAGAVAVIGAGTAAAQYVPLDAHGYRAAQIRAHYQSQTRAGTPAGVTAPVVATTSGRFFQTPAAPSSATAGNVVGVRGTDGVVRYFPVAADAGTAIVVQPLPPASAAR